MRDDPVRGDPLRDAPASVGAVGALGRFHVLPGDQRQQPDRLGSPGSELLLGQVAEQPVRIGDQRVDQFRAGRLVVPGDARLARAACSRGAVQCSAITAAAPGTSRRDPADRRDQLGDRVLGGHRVIEHRGVQRPPGLARSTPRSARPPPAPHQRSGSAGREAANRRRQYVNVVAWNPAAVTGSPHAAFHRRSKVTASTVSSIRQPVQRLQHDHRGHHIGRHARPPPTRREQVGEHLIREQLPPMPGQEREHAARPQQVPGHRLHIQQTPLILRSSLHHKIIPNPEDQQAQPRGLFRALLGPVGV